MANIISDIGSALGSGASAAVTGWLGPVLSIINKVIPDPAAKAQAQIAVLQMQQTGQLQEEANSLQILQGQVSQNLADAQSGGWFRAGWRPAVGWICATGLGYQLLLQPLLSWPALIWHFPTPPILDSATLYTLVTGMLGLGAARTVEKVQGLP